MCPKCPIIKRFFKIRPQGRRGDKMRFSHIFPCLKKYRYFYEVFALKSNKRHKSLKIDFRNFRHSFWIFLQKIKTWVFRVKYGKSFQPKLMNMHLLNFRILFIFCLRCYYSSNFSKFASRRKRGKMCFLFWKTAVKQEKLARWYCVTASECI